jgi:hypothetical protein
VSSAERIDSLASPFCLDEVRVGTVQYEQGLMKLSYQAVRKNLSPVGENYDLIEASIFLIAPYINMNYQGNCSTVS